MSRQLVNQSTLPAIAHHTLGGVFHYGTSVPSDGTTGYAPGCIFLDLDASAGSQVYVNVGTVSSANFDPLTGGVSLAALTATAAEINQACDESANIETLAATEVLVASDSGKTLFLAHATEFDTKLPAPAAGLRFTFIVGLAPSTGSYTVTTNGTTQNVIHGSIVSTEDAAGSCTSTAGTPVDVITFVADKAVVGDRVELICDGTYWYATGTCNVQDAITLA